MPRPRKVEPKPESSSMWTFYPQDEFLWNDELWHGKIEFIRESIIGYVRWRLVGTGIEISGEAVAKMEKADKEGTGRLVPNHYYKSY